MKITERTFVTIHTQLENSTKMAHFKKLERMPLLMTTNRLTNTLLKT